MKIGVVIVTYNPMQWLSKCLETIIKSNIELEIILVDNASTDHCIDFINENFPKVQTVLLNENIGFGKANNVGLKKALEIGCDYFVLLNQDVYVMENSIRELIEVAKQNPDYGIISPIHLNGKATALDLNFSNYIIPSKCPDFYSDAYLNNFSKPIYSLSFVNAAAWLITKECLEVVGGFNPSFFHYGEDDNYCHRVLYHGFKIGIVPKSIICHDREIREKSAHFDDVNKKRRRIILNYSNPNYNLKKPILFISLIKGIIKRLLFLDFNNLNKEYLQFKNQKTIDYKKIIGNREQSKKKSLNFL